MSDTIKNILPGGNGKITDYLHADFDDLIFEGRNKEYGGYVLRKKYPKHLTISCLLTITLFLAGIYAPDFFRWLTTDHSDREENGSVTEVTLSEPPPGEEVLQPPPPPPAAKPKPVPAPDAPQKVKKDEVVQEIPPSPAQEPEPPEPQPEDEDSSETESQNPPPTPPANPQPEASTKAMLEQMPAFPSGQDSLFRYVYRHIIYPATAREKGVEGTVIVKFIIEKNGKVSNVQAVNDIGGGCAQEAMRVVRSMPPWSPGRVRGQPVKVQLRLPIEFRLTDK